MRRESFLTVILFLATTFSAMSASAHEINYRIKDFSGFAHWLLDDQRQNVMYMIPMDGVGEHLATKFDIKRTVLRAMDRRMVPGKTIVHAAKFFIYGGDSDVKRSEPHILFGSLSEGVPHTYVVRNDELVFVESTAKPVEESCKDRFSKHWVISGLKTRVRFAGEFYVYKDIANNMIHVVFDNGSGTYRPDTAMLPNLLKVLDANFAEEGITFHVKAFDQKVNAEKMFAGSEDCLYKN